MSEQIDLAAKHLTTAMLRASRAVVRSVEEHDERRSYANLVATKHSAASDEREQTTWDLIQGVRNEAGAVDREHNNFVYSDENYISDGDGGGERKWQADAAEMLEQSLSKLPAKEQTLLLNDLAQPLPPDGTLPQHLQADNEATSAIAEWTDRTSAIEAHNFIEQMYEKFPSSIKTTLRHNGQKVADYLAEQELAAETTSSPPASAMPPRDRSATQPKSKGKLCGKPTQSSKACSKPVAAGKTTCHLHG